MTLHQTTIQYVYPEHWSQQRQKGAAFQTPVATNFSHNKKKVSFKELSKFVL